MAGGSGSRTEQDVPKQFMRHPDIDTIIVACLDGWQTILEAYAKEAGITKLQHIVRGGANGQESARKALEALQGICKEDDIVIIHDAVRPMVSAEIISDCIVKCRQYGSGLAAVRCQETIVRTEDGEKGDSYVKRKGIMRVQTPQAYLYGKALRVHEKAHEQGVYDAVYTNILMLDMGETLYFSKGSEKNLKITTMEDVEIFKALYRVKKEDWVK